MPIGPVRSAVAACNGEKDPARLAGLFSPSPLPRSGIVRRDPRRALLGAVLCLALGAGAAVSADAQSPPPAASAGALDGLTFTGPVGAIGKSKPYNTDSIVFEDGHFVSTDCVQYGFTRAPYAAKRVGDEIHFQAVTRSPTHGTMTWEGVIRGDRAQAEYRWVRERWFWTQRGEYWFKGQRDVAPRR